MSKVITSKQAAELVKNGDTLAIQGVVCTSVVDELIKALSDHYVETKSPENITLVYQSGIGNKQGNGADYLAHEGLIGKLKCGHVGLTPKINKMISEEKFPAYLIPQGVLSHMFRAVAGKKPGVITEVGLKTYADPRLEGCKANKAAINSGEEVVELLQIEGQDYLRYKPIPIDICFIRGTTADQNGNVSIEKEAIEFDQFSMAAATKNSGGIVVVQVERVVDVKSLKPHDVVIPGTLIDHIVIAKPENHKQCNADELYHPEWCGEARIPYKSDSTEPLDAKKVCGRRAAFLLKKDDHMNLGIGTPEAVAGVVAEEGFQDKVMLSIEAGIFGGIPASGLRICCAYNPECIISHGCTFDIYDGGGIDVAVLGAAEIDKYGNVNVSKFNGGLVGPGGFINISQGTNTVVFVGTFTTGKVKYEIGNGKISVIQEGKYKKFKENVEQVTFSGEYAYGKGKNILYVTERAVFKLVEGGIELIEIAPGMDLQKDILDQMEFKPFISEKLTEMDSRIFIDEPMGLTV